MSALVGVILAGGLSRRMQGNEKTLMNVAGKSLLHHVHDRLTPQVSRIVLNANGDLDRFGAIDLPFQEDTVSGFAGPLAGVLAGMRWAQQNTAADHVISVAADTPFFPDDYVERMVEVREKNNAQIALAGSGGRRHPVFGLWPVELADQLETFLIDEEGRKVMKFVERYANCVVEFEFRENDPFFNVNTPEDLLLAEKLADAGSI